MATPFWPTIGQPWRGRPPARLRRKLRDQKKKPQGPKPKLEAINRAGGPLTTWALAGKWKLRASPGQNESRDGFAKDRGHRDFTFLFRWLRLALFVRHGRIG
jgi:hypothetical protein